LRPTIDAQRETSRRLIAETARLVPTAGRAIVLGAGRCDEIPLDVLADYFSEVKLIDADRSALDAGLAAAALPEQAAQRVHTQLADFTGLTDTFIEQATALADEADSYSAWHDRVVELANGLVPEPFVISAGNGAPSETFDLVVASCVLSQLHVGATQRIAMLVAERFSAAQEKSLHESQAWTDALAGLARKMEESFVESLFRLVNRAGRIYLSDTVQVCFVHGTPERDWATEGMYRMTRTTNLADYLDDRFTVERLGEWVWVHNAPTKPGEIGQVYRVQGLRLALSGAA